ncbi:hypothetical protein SAMN05216233_12159 [Desulfoluna spongiiphila]|uniref:Uncharacterized protein n=1 Tax=Desulfoluna spongiiphila TaxID=419481 RepID=A0A1G5IQC5_9BACT|nr:hypothetical protein SAMN05216233_12159 [Desulfoluna spongiiphila]
MLEAIIYTSFAINVVAAVYVTLGIVKYILSINKS